MNPSQPSLLDPQLLWATFALVAVLLLGALVIAWFDRARKKPDSSVLTPGDQLTAFRLSYERGELSQEEYERIRTRLAPLVRQQYQVPAPAAKNPGGTASPPAATESPAAAGPGSDVPPTPTDPASTPETPPPPGP